MMQVLKGVKTVLQEGFYVHFSLKEGATELAGIQVLFCVMQSFSNLSWLYSGFQVFFFVMLSFLICLGYTIITLACEMINTVVSSYDLVVSSFDKLCCPQDIVF